MAIDDYCRTDGVGSVVNENTGRPGTTQGPEFDPNDLDPRDGGPATYIISVPPPSRNLSPSPPVPTPPFPQPVNFQRPMMNLFDDLYNSTEPQRIMLSAERKVTVIPDKIFLSENIRAIRIREFLQERSTRVLPNGDREQSRRNVLRGTTWFRENGFSYNSISEHPDYFRWSLGAIWEATADREKFAKVAIGPRDNILGYDSKAPAYLFDSGIFQFYGHNDPRVIDPFAPFAPRQEFATPSYTIQSNPNFGSGGSLEVIRFGLKLPDNIGPTLPRPFTRPGDENRARFFARKYLPNFIKDGNKYKRLFSPDRFALFLNTILLGENEKYNPGGFEEFINAHRQRANFVFDDPQLEDEIDSYRTGILNFDKYFNDCVFDAPVAFFEEELDSIILSPFHSAKITGEFGNLDEMLDRKYGSIYEIPNLYRLYGYLDLEKTYASKMLAQMNFVGRAGSFNVSFLNIIICSICSLRLTYVQLSRCIPS